MIFCFPGHEVDLSNPSNPAFLSAQIKALEEARNQAKLGQSIPYSSLQAVPGSAASEARQARIHGYVFCLFFILVFSFQGDLWDLKKTFYGSKPLWLKRVYANNVKMTQSTVPLPLHIDVELIFEGVRLIKVISYQYFWYFNQLMFYLIMQVHFHQHLQYFD